ncbi:peptidase associated/transthyretin-like domain-containing protein [Hanstruepera marina]|uniref:hypothetical protein n=1 Tax=Hanstruepera marina TaxID=2873265 RepID=UPI001CA75662|nr:hypothetical protein [Hanstruepera marina]
MPFKNLQILTLLLASVVSSAQVTIKNGKTQDGIPYATVSFGNGQGIFADDEGVFIFTKKLYPDVDTLFVTSLGYKDVTVPTSELSDTILMDEEVSQLNEVVLIADNRKFTEETLKPYLDDDYYHCWLPTIESEIAVIFRNPDTDLKKLSTIHFPITLESKDWKKRKKKNAEKKPFSTLFKVKFYENNNGLPGQVLTYDNIVFKATEKNGDVHNLDVSAYNITFPENGFFVSLQVLGYTDTQGKLLPNKKYKEIKSKNGIVKIPTNFRPLLPFTSEIPEHRTYIKRVFINGNNWVQFRKGNIESGLFSAGLNNYGIGISYKVYNDE